MYRLLQFFLKYQAFFLFLLLEVACIWFIVRNNNYQSAAFFNSSNHLVGNVLARRDAVSGFISLNKVNKDLVHENAVLRSRLIELEGRRSESSSNNKRPLNLQTTYSIQDAKVIKNSTRLSKNYLTINKGIKHGIEPGMAVINSDGAIGKVKAASDHFSTVISVLNPDVQTSTLIQKSNTMCTVKWEGKDPTKASLLYVPRHIEISQGDTIVTSGFNAVFPSGIPVGIVHAVNLEEDAAFYDIEIEFAPKFDQLTYVYVIKNALKSEKDSLEASLDNE